MINLRLKDICEMKKATRSNDQDLYLVLINFIKLLDFDQEEYNKALIYVQEEFKLKGMHYVKKD